jgi:hypothetical protein
MHLRIDVYHHFEGAADPQITEQLQAIALGVRRLERLVTTNFDTLNAAIIDPAVAPGDVPPSP